MPQGATSARALISHGDPCRHWYWSTTYPSCVRVARTRYCFPFSRPDFVGLWIANENLLPRKPPETIRSTLVVTTQLLRRFPVSAGSRLRTVPTNVKSALLEISGVDALLGFAEAGPTDRGTDGFS